MCMYGADMNICKHKPAKNKRHTNIKLKRLFKKMFGHIALIRSDTDS